LQPESQKKTDNATITIEISYTVKPYVSNAEKAVFGLPLKTLLSRPDHKDLAIPKFVQDAINVLRETSLDLDGIFRESGNQLDIAEMRSVIDSGEVVDMKATDSMHNITGLLKLYFRELPEPLLSFLLHDQFMQIAQCIDETSEKKHLKELSVLISQLPIENQTLLKELTLFLYEVSEHSKVNRMTADNLGIVFGPNLLRSNTEDIVTTMMKAPGLYALIIKYAHELF